MAAAHRGRGRLASAVVFWFAPLLGAIMMIGTMGGLLVGVGPSVVEMIARLLSGLPPRGR
jgi:hypothetical protein